MNEDTLVTAEKFRRVRRAEIRRRVAEFILLAVAGAIVVSNDRVREVLRGWRRGLIMCSAP
jgi:hypothetical protein